MPSLAGKRVLVLAAETELGRAAASALGDAGATLALVAATGDAEGAFGVQRLARKLGAAASQAIDATNETAVRVMLRQVSKALGGLDGIVVASAEEAVREIARRFGERELARAGGGAFVVAEPGVDVVAALAALLASA